MDPATSIAKQLIDHRQALDLLAAGASIEYEVGGLDVVGAEHGQGPRP